MPRRRDATGLEHAEKAVDVRVRVRVRIDRRVADTRLCRQIDDDFGAALDDEIADEAAVGSATVLEAAEEVPDWPAPEAASDRALSSRLAKRADWRLAISALEVALVSAALLALWVASGRICILGLLTPGMFQDPFQRKKGSIGATLPN